MAPSAAAISSTLLLLALLLPAEATVARHRHRLGASLLAAAPNVSQPPTTFFEVDRPIRPPRGSAGPCSTLLLSGTFGATYGRPPITAAYAPPACLAAARAGAGGGGGALALALAVLEWSADCRGRQFDRIFGVWLSGAELLRSCTAEPRPNGILWTVSRDITRYAALLAEPGEVAVYLGNLVDKTYTGVYHANLTLHLYFHDTPPQPPAQQQADLIVPISRSLPLNDGQWFAIQNATDVQSKKLAIPSNTYRAILEVFVSFHSNDEFWYTNPPNDYIQANNLSNVPGNGAFREVVARVDGEVVGAVWPFTVIYTGGVNPLLWRPITGIGSFNLPTYDIDITPFLGKLLDGEEHDFGFGVTNALDVWYIDANLHLWLDHNSEKTTGSLLSYDASGLDLNVNSEFSGLDGQFVTSAIRHVSATGWVKSSYGEVTTTFYQRFRYENSNVFSKNGTVQITNQTIDAKSGIFTKDATAVLLSEELHKIFPLYIYTGTTDKVGDEYSLDSLVKLGINEKKTSGGKLGFLYSSLHNAQTGRGTMRVKKNLVVSGLGKTHQVYKYVGTDGCYFRDVSSRNYTILFDRSDDSCSKGAYSGASTKLNDQPARRKLLVNKL
ncbi:unnamed protein product [Urochloa decumbens]|uniref:Peptide N-acetyl-beta-D-glucosaminyl asparaginase amidase A N-terminal domain-containing protein n=1 Tax=Urochloa decumbens TaxID=240449 RepID=A0ABC8ZB73_9POAL